MVPVAPAFTLLLLVCKVIWPVPPRAVSRIEPSGPWLTPLASSTPRALTTACLLVRASMTICPPLARKVPMLVTLLSRTESVVRL